MTARFLKQALLSYIIAALLMVLTVSHWSVNHVADVADNNVNRVADEADNDVTLEMNRMITSQGIKCEELTYAKLEEMQLNKYWHLVNNYQLFHRMA